MSEAPLMLGVSGLRGIVGKSLTPEVAAKYGTAFGAWLRERARTMRGSDWGHRPVVVMGADGRAGYESIKDATARGLVGAGARVIDVGVAMTPTVAVVADHEDADGGVVITASHNPQEWNGIKCLVRDEIGREGASACAPSAAVAAEIIDWFKRGGAMEAPGGSIEARGPNPKWHLDPVLRGVRESSGAASVASRRFGVVLDSVNGAGRLFGPVLLDTLACRLVRLGDDAKGVFWHTPEPLRENLTGLVDAVRASRAAVGFAQDPDADRLAIVDERGEYIGEEYTLVLAAEALLSEAAKQRDSETGKKDRVLVTNLSTSRMIDDVAARHGARVVRTAVGEANVVEAMKREAAAGNDVVVGGEGNGGVIWPLVTYVRDSLSAMGLVLSLMARRGQRLSEIVASMPSYAIEKRKVELTRKEDARPAVEKIARAYAKERIDLQDGVRVDFSQGPLAGKAWLHVRASNTEPIMRLIAEAPTVAEARGVLDEAAGVIG